jgi:hypothetical protein
MQEVSSTRKEPTTSATQYSTEEDGDGGGNAEVRRCRTERLEKSPTCPSSTPSKLNEWYSIVKPGWMVSDEFRTSKERAASRILTWRLMLQCKPSSYSSYTPPKVDRAKPVTLRNWAYIEILNQHGINCMWKAKRWEIQIKKEHNLWTLNEYLMNFWSRKSTWILMVL